MLGACGCGAELHVCKAPSSSNVGGSAADSSIAAVGAAPSSSSCATITQPCSSTSSHIDTMLVSMPVCTMARGWPAARAAGCSGSPAAAGSTMMPGPVAAPCTTQDRIRRQRSRGPD